MSQKGPLRRLDAGVRWLETDGMYLLVESRVRALEMLLDIADRADADPAFAARWTEAFPSIVLPPPRRMDTAARPKPESAAPPERPLPVLPVLRDAPQDHWEEEEGDAYDNDAAA